MSKKRFLSIFAVLFVIIFSVACVFTACGKSNDDDKGSDTTTEEPETPETPGTEPSEEETVYTVIVTGDNLSTGTTTDYALALGITDGDEGDVFGSATLTASLLEGGTAVEGATAQWASSDGSIATVTNGAITAVANGETTVTVTYYAEDGTTELAKATIAVTVTDSRTTEPEPTPEPETEYTITVTGGSLTTGTTTDYALSLEITDGTEGGEDVYGSATLTASLLADGAAVEGATATWASASETVAEVKDGVITAVAGGTATITVTYYGDDGTTVLKSATIAVTVTDSRTTEPEPTPEPETVYTITVTGDSLTTETTTDYALALGITDEDSGDVFGSATLTASLLADGTAVEDAAATWTSNDSSIATVTNGVITAVAGGTATITVTYYGDDGTTVLKSATIAVTVTDSRTTEPEPTPEPETVYTVTVTGDSLTTGTTTDYALALGITDGDEGDVFESATLTASLLADGTAVEGATAQWASSDGSIATVTNGAITAVANGETTVTVTYYAEDGTTELAKATIAVTVTDSRTTEPEPTPEPAVESITLNESSLTLTLDKQSSATGTITATVAMTDSSEFSGDLEISAVEGVTFTQTNASGVVTITVTATAAVSAQTVTVSSGNTSASFTLTVEAYVPDYQIEIDTEETGISLEVGDDTTKLVAKVTVDGEDLPDGDNGTITWNSSDETVATVDPDGTVHAVGAGTTKITVTYTNGENIEVKSGAITVTVTEATTTLPYELEIDFSNPSSTVVSGIGGMSSDESANRVAMDDKEILTYVGYQQYATLVTDSGTGEYVYFSTREALSYDTEGRTKTFGYSTPVLSNYFIIDLSKIDDAKSVEIEIVFSATNEHSDAGIDGSAVADGSIALTKSLDSDGVEANTDGYSDAVCIASAGEVGEQKTLTWKGSIEDLQTLYIEFSITTNFYSISIKFSEEIYVAPDTYEIKIDEIAGDVHTGDIVYLTAVVTKNGEETVSNPAILWSITEGESLAELEQDTGVLNVGETAGTIKVKATYSYGAGEETSDEITIYVTEAGVEADPNVLVHLDFDDASTYSWITTSSPTNSGVFIGSSGTKTEGILSLHLGSQNSGAKLYSTTSGNALDTNSYYNGTSTDNTTTYFQIDVKELVGETITVSIDARTALARGNGYLMLTTTLTTSTSGESVLINQQPVTSGRGTYTWSGTVQEGWSTLYIYGRSESVAIYSIDVTKEEGEVAPAHVHNYVPVFVWNGTGVTVTQAECTNEDGLCDQLTTSVTGVYPSSSSTGQTKDATCTEAAQTLYTCTITWNGTSYTDEHWVNTVGEGAQAALGHEWVAGENTTEPTCTQAGTRTDTCSRCGETTEVIVPALGHSYGDPVYKTAAEGVTEGWYASCERCQSEIFLESGAGYTFTVTNMAELGSALALDGAVIVLGFDAVGSITVTKTITIDLNGHTMVNDDGQSSGEVSHTIVVGSGGVLTIEDTQESGKIDNISGGCAAVFVESGGTATLAGGTFTRSLEGATGGTYYTIVNHGEVVIEDGATVKTDAVTGSSMVENGGSEDNATMTINGGRFESSSSSMIKNDVNGKLVITGGEFTGNGSTAVILNCAELEISGGTFTQTATGEGVYNLVVWNYENSDASLYPTAEISGGTFTGGTTATVYNDGNGTMKIIGGTFDNGEYATVVSVGSLTIEGGEFTSSGNGAYIYLVWAYSGNVVINGGTFTAGDATDYGVVASNGGTVAIYGGTFGGTTGSTNLWAGEGSCVTVYGGAFSEDPFAFVGGDYYAACDEEDGLWHVQANDWAIEIAEQNVTVTAGEETTVTVKIYLNGTETDTYTGTVSWSSSDDAVATVDENGTVHTTAQGEVTITATYAWGDGKHIEATIKIYIEPAAGEAKTVTADFTVAGGWEATLSSDALSSAGSAGVALDGAGILKYVNTYPNNSNGMAYYVGWTTVNGETCIQTGNYNKYGATATPNTTSGKSNYFVIDTTGYTSVTIKVEFSLISNANNSGAATSGELGVTKAVDAVSSEQNNTSAALTSPLAKADTGTTAGTHVTLEYTCDDLTSLSLTDGLLYICYTTSVNIYKIEITLS